MKRKCIYKNIIFDDYYVTDGGRIYSKKNGEFRLLKPWYITFKSGYKCPYVSLSEGNKVYNCKVAILVANAFLPNVGEYYTEVDHIDTNPLNNSAYNLRWVTHSQNTKNPNTIKNKIKSRSGIKLGARKRGVKKVLCIETGIVYNSISEAAKVLGINPGAISNACSGRCHSSGGYTWKYYE